MFKKSKVVEIIEDLQNVRKFQNYNLSSSFRSSCIQLCAIYN